MWENVVDGICLFLWAVLVFAMLMGIAFGGLMICNLAEVYEADKRALREMCPHDRLTLKRKRNLKPYQCDRCGLKM